MYIDFKNVTIELTTAEARKAAKIGTEEYNALIEVQKNFPQYQIKVLPTRKSGGDGLKGLTYEFMEKHISIHGTKEQLDELNELRFNANLTRTRAASYGEIKKWFLENFPNIKAASASKNVKGVA